MSVQIYMQYVLHITAVKIIDFQTKTGIFVSFLPWIEDSLRTTMIMKTHKYLTPLTHYLYEVKLGFTGVYFFLILLLNINHGHS